MEGLAELIGGIVISVLFIALMVALIVGVLAACGWVIRRFSRPT